jgi:uroporphyrinogen III methyltransferase/synthase
MSATRPPPLAGLRVAVTRPRGDAAELAALLEEAGAEAVLVPLTRIVPPADEEALRRSVSHLDRYDWIVFTSARAVHAVAQVASLMQVPFGRAAAAGGLRARVAAVGPATAGAVFELTGRVPDVTPPRSTGHAIVPAMLEHGVLKGARVLWPRAEQPRPELPHALAAAGAVLDDPVAYRTLPDTAVAAALARRTAGGDIDVLTFTAPSAVECYAEAAVPGADCVIAVIGPATAAAARERGLPVHVEPDRPIISALVDALVRFHDDRASGAP